MYHLCCVALLSYHSVNQLHEQVKMFPSQTFQRGLCVPPDPSKVPSDVPPCRALQFAPHLSAALARVRLHQPRDGILVGEALG